MENKLVIPCVYRDETVIDLCVKEIEAWSDAHKGHRQYGWVKISDNRINFLFNISSGISLKEKSRLYARFVKISGISFVSTTFN